ncbi:ribonuclease VapC [Spirochaetia bacterium]|nr:ribonuclease VapC [Spirochaetia bacterium]
MIVADTSVWIDYWNGEDTPQAVLLDRYLLTSQVVIGDLIIAEFLRDIRNDAELSLAKGYLQRQPYRCFAGKRLAYKAAENYRFLRKKGITIRKTVDMFIGTFCMEYNLPLLHDDRDFDPMEAYLGLKVVR